MAASVKAGRIVDVQTRDTLSDGTAGGIESGAITFDPCRTLVDDWVLVSEAEIRSAMIRVFDNHRLVIEGAAGVTVAGFLKMAPQLAGKTVALVVCGGNIDTGMDHCLPVRVGSFDRGRQKMTPIFVTVVHGCVDADLAHCNTGAIREPCKRQYGNQKTVILCGGHPHRDHADGKYGLLYHFRGSTPATSIAST
jgi:hypothetical protein